MTKKHTCKEKGVVKKHPMKLNLKRLAEELRHADYRISVKASDEDICTYNTKEGCTVCEYRKIKHIRDLLKNYET